MNGRCEAKVTKRDSNKLPPNTWTDRCSRQAIVQYAGEGLCQRHFDARMASLARARVRQNLYTRRVASEKRVQEIRNVDAHLVVQEVTS